MKRSGPPKRRSPLKRKGARSKRQKPELDAAYAVVRERSGGNCEARLEGCAGRATENHHIGKRSVWPELVSHPDNLVAICRWCHERLTLNPMDHVEDGLHMPRTKANEIRFGLQ